LEQFKVTSAAFLSRNDTKDVVGSARRKEEVHRLPNAVAVLQEAEQSNKERAIVLDCWKTFPLDLRLEEQSWIFRGEDA
jgi:hypothetical protein